MTIAAQGRVADPPTRFPPAEKANVLRVVSSPEYRDLSPKQVVPRLADDDGQYIAAESMALSAALVSTTCAVENVNPCGLVAVVGVVRGVEVGNGRARVLERLERLVRTAGSVLQHSEEEFDKRIVVTHARSAERGDDAETLQRCAHRRAAGSASLLTETVRSNGETIDERRSP